MFVKHNGTLCRKLFSLAGEKEGRIAMPAVVWI